MEVDENGVVIVADDDDDDDVDPMLDNLDLEGVDSGNSGASTGADLTAHSTECRLFPPGNLALQGDDYRNAGAIGVAAGGDLTLAVDCGVPASDGNMLSVGMTGDNNLTVNGDTLTDNVNDSTKSLPVPALTGDYRDARTNVDEDAMSTTEAETVAKANKESNTTATKSIALLNTSTIAPVWSLTDRIPRSVAAASVTKLLWRKANPYKKMSAIEKGTLVISVV